MGFRLTLPAWLLAGLALDGIILAGLWLLLYAMGPLVNSIESWLDAIGFVSVPWLVHVVALSVIFSSKLVSRPQSGRLLLRTLLFVFISAITIPLGFLTGYGLACLFYGLLSQISQMDGPAVLWCSIFFFFSLFLISTVIVAAGIGILLHFLRDRRKNSLDSRFHQPRFRSDVLGAVIAAFLAFTGVLVASSFGQFDRSGFAPGGDLLGVPRLPATLLIGIIAFLPHLFMTGIDILRADQRQEKRNA